MPQSWKNISIFRSTLGLTLNWCYLSTGILNLCWVRLYILSVTNAEWRFVFINARDPMQANVI